MLNIDDFRKFLDEVIEGKKHTEPSPSKQIFSNIALLLMTTKIKDRHNNPSLYSGDNVDIAIASILKNTADSWIVILDKFSQSHIGAEVILPKLKDACDQWLMAKNIEEKLNNNKYRRKRYDSIRRNNK